MDVRFLSAVAGVALALTIGFSGCTPQTPQAPEPAPTPQMAGADERQALVAQVQAYRRDAENTRALTPERKAELQRLAADIRAWQGRTGRDDPRASQESITARRNDSPGGGGDCEDCPGYSMDGDRICFLESEGECPADDGSDLQIGRVCVYTCLWIGAEAEPARKAP